MVFETHLLEGLLVAFGIMFSDVFRDGILEVDERD